MKKIIYSLLCILLVQWHSRAQVVVFSDDFEGGLANWTYTGLWNTTTAYAYSPTTCFTDSPDGNYPDMFSSEAAMNVSADLSTALDADVQFMALVDLETAFDYVYVDVSDDAGASWINVYVLNGEGMFTWTNYTIPIGAFVGSPDVRVRFRFESDAAYNVDGLYIDDFKITKYNIDVSPPLILHTPTNLYEGNLEETSLTAEIIDASGISSATLYYNVDGGAFTAVPGDLIGGDTYSFIIPTEAPGSWIDYYIEAIDDFGVPNTATTETYQIIAGNYIGYDDATIDFVADIGTLSLTGYVSAAVKVTLAGSTDVVTAIIQNYTDYMRPNNDIRFHVWADDGGFPGADLVTPFYVTPEPTLDEPNKGTRIDLRGVPELEGIFGDVFIGYDVPGGVAWISYTGTGVINRSYVQTAFGWSEFFGDFHFRVVTSALTGAPMADFSVDYLATPTLNFTDESTGSPTEWYWDFGDGGTSTLENPTHTYLVNGVYNVCLTATNMITSDTYCEAISINDYEVPVAAFSFTGDPTVTFTDLSSNLPTSWYWDFNDGTNSTEQNPVHTFLEDGSYFVCLTATNAEGFNTNCQAVIIINTPKVPVVDFEWSLPGGTTVNFNDLSSNTPAYWEWSFGDGGTSSEQNPSHFYPAPTSYTVCLTAGNVAGEATLCKVIDNFNAVGENGNSGKAISVFPNPVTDHVMVVYSDLLPAVCTLRDALGNALLTQEIVGNTVIDMQSLPAGIYYIDVLRGEAAFGISIMKQ